MNRAAPIRRGCPAGHGHAYPSRAAADNAVAIRGAAGDPRQCGRCGGWYLHAAAARTGFTAEVRLLARVRAGRGDASRAVCEACGVHLGRHGGDVHHRLGRGSGGCRDEVVNGLANAALLCRRCHDRCTDSDPRMRDDAAGWWIRHGNGPGFDPRYVPVLLYSEGTSGVIRWLHESEPRYLEYEPEAVAA